jgi:hypothetical protein
MFKGFGTPGRVITTVRPHEPFAGIPSASFDRTGLVGGVVSDGLLAWFNAGQGITLNGTNVSAWADTSGTYTVTQATAANQPAYVTGDVAYKQRPYVSFDGSNDVLTASNILGVAANAEYTIIAVAAVTTVGSVAFAANTTGEYRVSNAGTARFNGGGGLIQATQGGDTAIHLYKCEINRTTGVLRGGVDNNASTGTAAIPTTLTDYSTGVLQFGGNGASRAQVLIFDVMFYNRILSAAEQRSMYNYFKNLYGIA